MADQVETLVMRFEPDDESSKRVEQSAARLAARVQQLKQEIDELKGEARDLNKALDQDDKAFEEAIRNTVKLEKARQELRKTEQQLRDSIDDTSDAALRAARDQAGLYGDVGTRSRDIASGVAAVGGDAFEGVVGRGADILDAVEGVQLLSQELPELASNLGITKQNAALLAAEAVVLGAAFFAAKDIITGLAEGAQAAREAVNAQIDALKEYNEFINAATTEDVRLRLEELQQRRNINAQYQSDLLELRNAVEAGIDISDQGAIASLSEGAVRAADRFGFMEVGLKDIDEALTATRQELNTTDEQFRLLAGALSDGTTAANDAAKREREYTQAKIEGLEREARIQIEATTLTQDQLDKRLAAIATERDAYEGLLDELQGLEQTDQVVEKIGEVNDRLSELSEDARLLDSVARPLVAANEELARAEEAAAEQTKALARNVDIARKVYESAAASSAKVAEDLAKVEQDRIDAAQDYADRTLEIEQDRNLKLTQEAEKFALERVNDLADHYKDLADLDREYYEERGQLLEDLQADLNNLDLGLGEDLAGLRDDLTDDLADITQDRLDALRDYNKEAQRASEDHYKRLEDIQRSAQNDIRSASARLDALGIYEAQKNAEEQLQVEQDRYETEQQRRQEDFRDQQRLFERERRERLQAYQEAERDLRERHRRERAERIQAYRQDLQDLDRQHARERQEQIAAFNEKIRREDQQRALELRQQEQQWQIENQRRQVQYEAERAALGQHYSALLTRTADGLYQVELAYQAWLDSMAARSPMAGTTVTTPVGVGVLPAFANGGIPPLNRPVLVGENGPELVRFRQPARISPMGQGGGFGEGNITINVYDQSGNSRQTAYLTRREFEDVLRRNR